MSLHPNLVAVADLVGTWQGTGRGEYPTIESFQYTEELTFTDVGKPFLHYAQRTWSPAGAPMHVETGYLRLPEDGTIELILAQPTGQTELGQGRLATEDRGFSAELHSGVVNSASARRVDATTRRYHLRGDELTTTFSMAAAGHPMTHHLHSVLSRRTTTPTTR